MTMNRMSTTLRPARNMQPSPRPSGSEQPVAAAAGLAALWAVFGSLALVALPVVAAWAASGDGQSRWVGTLQVAADLWLLAHHAGITIPGGHLGITPLGLTLVPVAACWLSGRRLARVLDPGAGRGAVRGIPAAAFPPVRALVAFVVAYAVLAGLLASLAGTAAAAPIVPQAVLAAAVLSALAGTAGVATYRVGGLRRLPGAVLGRLPGPLARPLGPACAALGVHLLGSAAVLVGVVVAGYDRVLVLHRALHPDGIGAAVLVLGQLTLVPDFVVWTGALLAGPGFAVGVGTSVTPWEAVLGPLPALPLLGALPAPGALPVAARSVFLVPLLAGVVAGARLHGGGPAPWWRLPLDALTAALLAGTGLAAVAWLASGPAGPGRLAVTGPAPLPVGAAFAVEVLVGGLAALLVLRGVPAVVRAVRRRLPFPVAGSAGGGPG